jgi:hypothetical protein
MAGHGTRYEHEATNPIGYLLGDARKRNASHRMADQSHVSQILPHNLLNHRSDKVGDAKGGQISLIGASAGQINSKKGTIEQWANLVPARTRETSTMNQHKRHGDMLSLWSSVDKFPFAPFAQDRSTQGASYAEFLASTPSAPSLCHDRSTISG